MKRISGVQLMINKGLTYIIQLTITEPYLDVMYAGDIVTGKWVDFLWDAQVLSAVELKHFCGGESDLFKLPWHIPVEIFDTEQTLYDKPRSYRIEATAINGTGPTILLYEQGVKDASNPQ